MSQGIRGVVTDLFASAPSPWSGDYFFVRTWDRETGRDCFQISLESEGAGARDARDLVHQVATARGFNPAIEEIPFTKIPSPLWNSGFGGAEFEAVSKKLYRAVAPILVEFAAALNGDATQSYLLALRLMVAHAGATLLESEQRDLPSHSFDELLSLRLLSYRSHYEGVFARVSDPESFERRYAAYYDDLGARAREFIGSCLASPLPAADDALIRSWADVIRANFAEVREYFQAGLIVDQGLTLEDLNKSREVPLQPTRFHSFMSEALEQLLHRNPDFLAFRLQTSLLYSCLHTLGFSLVERYLFCYILARANEDVSGKSTQELQRGLGSLARLLAS
ncbi:hypothetical protein ABZV31_01970 [Streptomyces sp. NPDC005202]|uniref:hypothetical protein n=1 Tax=Streptomyces sp. NPDC005202 TaxID=3157021 RepID=UPI0033A5933D